MFAINDECIFSCNASFCNDSVDHNVPDDVCACSNVNDTRDVGNSVQVYSNNDVYNSVADDGNNAHGHNDAVYSTCGDDHIHSRSDVACSNVRGLYIQR